MTASDASAPLSNDPPLRQAAVNVVRRLIEAGHVAYFAGGCVRDRLMGFEPTDYDVATDARPESVQAVFRRTQSVGQSFGVILVRQGAHVIQVATFRTDGVYSDGRHPDSVSFSDEVHDANRRDFTVNGLFEDPLQNRIIDHVGGLADLKDRVVRAIGDPHARLQEDHLRMLRAVRFAARFGFAIEAETADAIRHGADNLGGVSRERIGGEVRRMLSDPNRAVAAWEMQYLGLDATVLGEASLKVAPTRLGRLPDECPYPTALAAWLLDRHETGADQAEANLLRWASALMLSNREVEDMGDALAVYSTLTSGWSSLGIAAQKRLASKPSFEQGLQLLQATDRQSFVDVRRKVLDLARSGLHPESLIDGEDLKALGLKPGPVFSTVLASVYDAQLEGAIATKPEALQLAKIIAQAAR